MKKVVLLFILFVHIRGGTSSSTMMVAVVTAQAPNITRLITALVFRNHIRQT